MIALAIEKGDITFALLVAIGFHCLLRTGELLGLQLKDFEFNSRCGVVSLMSTKSGLRTGSEEAVAIRDKLVLQILDTLFSTTLFHRGQKLWPYSGQAFRDLFASYMRAFRICHLGMKPYSLRRGEQLFSSRRGWLWRASLSVDAGGLWPLPAFTSLMAWREYHIFVFPQPMQRKFSFTLVVARLQPS